MYDQINTSNEQLPEQLNLKFYKIYMTNIVHWICFDFNICIWAPTKRDIQRVWNMRRNIDNPKDPYWEWYNVLEQEWKKHYKPFSDEIEKLYKQWQANNILIKGINI